MPDEQGCKAELNITSEFANLRLVLTHEPGPEIDRLTPSNKRELLFEDIPYLPKMKLEHRAFVATLEAEGVTVLRLRDLVRQLIDADHEARNRLVNHACASAQSLGLQTLHLAKLDTERILDILFGGLTAAEAGLLPAGAGRDFFVLPPIPNAYFSRDPACVVGSGVVSCKMHHLPRIRESLIVREVMRSHPRFKKSQLVFGDIGAEAQGEDRPFTIEGGDIIVLNRDAIAIGQSERTRYESIRNLAAKLFRDGHASRVYAVPIPAVRAYMHLDTVFTVVAEGLVVVYPEVIDNVGEVFRFEPLALGAGGTQVAAVEVPENRTLFDILRDELQRLQVIETGDGNLHHAEREQASDGTNVLAIAPGKVLSYERNERTNDALVRRGITVIPVEGSELVRGLGGPRCMTMPLVRSCQPPREDEAAS